MNFFTSGLGGVLGWIAVHPANTLAVQMTLQQASHGPGGKPDSFVAFSRNLIAKRGLASLYAGLSAGCTRQVRRSFLSVHPCWQAFLPHAAGGDCLSLKSTLLMAAMCGTLITPVACFSAP